MGYKTNSQRLQGRGDPGWFGDLIGKVTGVAKFIPGPIGAIAGALGKKSAPSQSPTGGTPPFTMPGGATTTSRLQERVPTPGLKGLGQRLIPGGETGFMTPRKRRRMDVLNVKALRRSTRRLAGFQREAKKVEKELRKLAPPARRRSGSSSAHHHHPKA